MNDNNLKNNELEKILTRLNILEKRIVYLESKLEPDKKIQTTGEKEIEDSKYVDINFSLKAPFENKLGEYGLAWLGNIVLFFAIAFLLQYINNAGKPIISIIVGVISVAASFTMSYYFRKSFTYLSFMFNLFGFIILYYFILRLHYYIDKPIIKNQVFATILLLIVTGIQLYYAFKKQLQVLAGLSYTFAIFTGFVYYQTHIFFLILISTAGLVLYSFWKYNWWKIMVFILCISYIIVLIWLFKNPVSLVNNPDDLTYHYAFFYYSILTVIYSLAAFKKPTNSYPENLIISLLLLAGIAYSALLLSMVILHFPNSFIPFFTSISIGCIAYSIILKFYSPWKYSPALFALYGFVAISITIYGRYHFPDSFLLLTCQSILVLVLALWYRSQIITLMNTFLLLILMAIYYKSSGTLQAVNFLIPFVAFLSARLINWQKKRLNIKTDFIRNIYLLTLFFSLLYATYKGLPGSYITISWLSIAGVYFGMSIILKNFKYRWMALANIMVSAFYLFLVDLSNIDLVFRILAFLAFAIFSIIISIYYVKKLKKNSADPTIEKAVKED